MTLSHESRPDEALASSITISTSSQPPNRAAVPESPTLTCKLSLTLLPQHVAVCRLESGDPIPGWATSGELWSVTRTPDEVSLVCEERFVPEGLRVERGWRCLKVRGPLDFGMTGVLISIADPLAAAGVSVFSFSTFDTDYVLVREEQVTTACAALTRAGHSVQSV